MTNKIILLKTIILLIECLLHSSLLALENPENATFSVTLKPLE